MTPKPSAAAGLLFLSSRLLPLGRMCGGFAPVPSALSSPPPSSLGSSSYAPPPPSSSSSISTRTSPRTSLGAVSKRQLAIFDGPELASIVSFLCDEEGTPTPDLAAGAPRKVDRLGGLTLVVGTTEGEEGGGRRIVGVERPLAEEVEPRAETEEKKEPRVEEDEKKKLAKKSDDGDGNGADDVISMGDGTSVYADSVATVPRSVSDEDAVSTAAAALCGVHCGAPANKEGGKAVVVGGSDYARFAARGLEAVGAEVCLVSIRPGVWLPSDSKVKLMEPAVGKLKLGFANAVGKFDSLIDTLGDEAKLGDVRSFANGDDSEEDPLKGGRWVVTELRKQHDCARYVSTVTRSQKYVLDEGLLFARNPVLKYQDDVERHVPPSLIRKIRPPKDYGPRTLQKLLDADVIYRPGRNENGPNADKPAFVRGCCFADLTELKTWPRDSSGGTPVRFGFPTIGEVDLSSKLKGAVPAAEGAAVAKGDGKADGDKSARASTNGAGKAKDADSAGKAARRGSGGGRFVADIGTLKELNEEILEKGKDSVLFLSAAYCRTCKAMEPLYGRMARNAKEEASNVIFARADTGGGPMGKQIGRVLGVEAVPAFVLFRGGERYGKPLRVKRLPSKKLDLAVEYLEAGKRWDPAVFEEEEEKKKSAGRKEKVGSERMKRSK